MSQKNMKLYKIDKNNESMTIDDSRAVVVELIHTAAALRANANKALKEMTFEKKLEFNATNSNHSRLMKQVRAYNRDKCDVRYSERSHLTHYVLDKVNLTLSRTNKAEVCNRLRIFHLYSVENEKDFETLKKFYASL